MPSCIYEVSFRLVATDVSKLYSCMPAVTEKLCHKSECVAGDRSGWLISHYESSVILVAPPRPVAAGIQALPASYEATVLLKCREPRDVIGAVKLLEAIASACKGVGLAPKEQ